MQIRKTLTFDDVLLVPKFSDLDSRNDPSLATKIGTLDLGIPIISAPMDTVTGWKMAAWLGRQGGLGVIHRFQSIDEQVLEVVRALGICESFVGAAVGVNNDAWERTKELVAAGADPLVVDVAHGHSRNVLNFIEKITSEYDVHVLSANIVTEQAVRDMESVGVAAHRVGVGGGSACTTRVVAGVGVPQLTAIMDVAKMAQKPIIADGGIKSSADVVKALAAGADAVMMGGFFSGFPVTPHPGKFRGMASNDALSQYKPSEEFTVEGASFNTAVDHSYERTFNDLLKGIRLGLSYVGAYDIRALQWKAEFVEVTNSGKSESRAHYSTPVPEVKTGREVVFTHGGS